MGRRLALMAEDTHESPWTRASGHESAIRVRGLGGSKVGVRVDLKPEGELLLFFAEGVTDLKPFNPSEWLRYRVYKIASGIREMTTVEVLLGRG